MYLIVGLGNPEAAYEETRHNIGFRVVEALAQKYQVVFRREREAQGRIGIAEVEGKKVLLVLPLTYMNSSGTAVRRSLAFFKLAPSAFIVVCDDADLPFGEVRLRERGSSGGHHGLESIEQHLGTRDYARVRFGIGNPTPGDLVPHVLGKFTKEEETLLPEYIDKACALLEKWLKENHEERKTTSL